MGISIPQGGLWLSLLPLPQAERKASARQWGRQHNISPFGVVHEHKLPPQHTPSSSQTSLDSPVGFRNDSKISEMQDGMAPILGSQKDAKVHRVPEVLETETASLPKGSPKSSQKPE